MTRSSTDPQPSSLAEVPRPGIQASGDKRIAAVDAARGCAMLMVCLSHIKHHFVASAPALDWALTVVTRIATPTFLLLSGFVVCWLLRNDDAGKARIALVDRALFLLVVAHALIGLAELPDTGFLEWYFGRSLVTDAVAVAILASVALRNRSATVLASIGISLCLASWVAAMTLDLESDVAKTAGAVLVDLQGARNPKIDAPLIPYVGIFCVGMALSRHFHPRLAVGAHTDVGVRLFLAGAAAMLVAMAGVLVWHFAKDYVAGLIPDPAAIDALRMAINPLTKRPPGPAYLLFYGGAGLILLAVFFLRRPAALMGRLVEPASVMGRASLMCFIVQDWIFHLIPRVFDFDEETSVAFWIMYFSVGVLVLYGLARVWGRTSGNRYMTVGLRRTLSPPAAAASASLFNVQ
jgi:uncharacterized membrane protein